MEAFRRAERVLPSDQAVSLSRVRLGMLRAKARVESPAAVLDYVQRDVLPLAARLDGLDRAELLMHVGDAQLDAGDARPRSEISAEGAGLVVTVTAAGRTWKCQIPADPAKESVVSVK